jgi:hypothetical protein
VADCAPARRHAAALVVLGALASGAGPADPAGSGPADAAGGATGGDVHWAYRPLAKPRPPAAPRAGAPGIERWARTPIDLFILEKLAAEGLAPSPEADRRTLLRRLWFDLLGLPPSPAELDAFLADCEAGAWERAVDRLLASPHHGERWARHWLDAVHFAESHGHDQDRPREHAWPYRDYLIGAFNDDRPYARFVEEQVAGDALFPDDPEAIVATGFLAAGPWDESSLRDIRPDSVDRLAGQYADRDDMVRTVMSALASTTVHCARCHEHKFDPISQTEYYGLQAVFAGVDRANRRYDLDPETAGRRRRLEARRDELARLGRGVPGLLDAPAEARVAAWERTLDAPPRWILLDPIEFRSEGGATLVSEGDGALVSEGKRPDKDTYTITAQVELPRVGGIRLDVLADDRLPHRGPGRQENGNLHLSEIEVSAAPAGDPAAARALALAKPRADFSQEGWSVEQAIDGNPASAWAIYPEVGKPHRAVFAVKEPEAAGGGRVLLSFRLRQLQGSGHLIGKLRLAATESPPPFDGEVLPPAVSAALATPAAARTDDERAELALHVLRREVEREIAALPPRALVYCATAKFEADGTFTPAGAPRPVHVLERGEVGRPGPEAAPGALSCLSGLCGLSGALEPADPRDEGARRAALARWLSDPRNGLVWRSIANRIWHHHFGRGLVETPDDFGRMGAAPTHPELLDWLAATLQETGGSLKALHRLIATSAVYRQASRYESPFAERDAGNRWLWRMSRRRLDAESFRDACLRIAGRLDSRQGGPSDRQFIESPGLHVTPTLDYLGFDPERAENYRRSVYRFLFRTVPDPFMESLDCPAGSQLEPRRNESITALQALAMLHDKVVARASEALAQATLAAGPELDARVADLFRRVLLRPPSRPEAAAVSAYAAEHGLANASRFLLNTNEFVFVD